MAAKKKHRKCKNGRRKDGHCRKKKTKKRRCPPRQRLGPISKLFKSIGF